MKKIIFHFLLLLFSLQLFADINDETLNEIEGIWVLPGVVEDNFQEINQHVFIETIDAKTIYVYWENAYFGEKDYFCKMVLDKEKQIFIGITNNEVQIALSFPEDIDYNAIISIGLSSVDERYSFIPFMY